MAPSGLGDQLKVLAVTYKSLYGLGPRYLKDCLIPTNFCLAFKVLWRGPSLDSTTSLLCGITLDLELFS